MTPLETFLFCLVSAVLSAVGTISLLTKKFMTKEECELKHKTIGTEFSTVSDSIDEMCGKQDLMFKMLRSVIVHLDIPKEDIERILNMTKESS